MLSGRALSFSAETSFFAWQRPVSAPLVLKAMAGLPALPLSPTAG
jgi:hypothetical protein